MEIVLINGSHRQNSQSLRITKYLAAQIPKLDASVTAEIVSLTGNPLPLWDDENNSRRASDSLQQTWEPYAQKLQAADGFVVISPEWHGMVPAGLKNFFLYCNPKEVGHKPAMIVTVSAGRGGSYPVAELRVSSYKNNRLCYVPDHLIVQSAEKMFAGDTPASDDDKYIRERADFALRILFEYAKALKSVRDSGKTFDKKFASGM